MAVLSAEEKAQRNRDTAALLAKINEVTGTPNTAQTMQTEFFKNAGVNVGINSKTNAVTIDGKPVKDYQYRNKPMSVESSTNQRKTDMQKKKEDRIEEKRSSQALSNKRAAAKKQYDDYVKSDEYKKRLEDNDKKARQQEVVNYFLPPEMQLAPKVIQDDKEIQLRAAMEQAEAEYNAAEDNKVIESDLKAITGLSGDERKQLEQYAVNQIRDQNMPVEFQNMPFFKTAEQEASGLIGKIGKQRADELAETYMRQENQKFAEEVAAKGREHAGTGFWSGLGSSLATIPVNLVSGVVGGTGQLQAAARNTGRFQTLDPNATGTALQNYTGAVRGQVAQNISGDVYDENGILIKDGGALRGLGSVAYQGAMSIADNAARAALGRVIGGVALQATDYAGKGKLVAGMAGSALAAANSFSQTLSEASEKGATPEQAITLATVSASIEALSEKIPLDNLIANATGGKQKWGPALLKALANAGIEATTEEISLIGTVLAEAAILREKSGYQRSLMGKILTGTAPEQAKLEALREILEEAKNTLYVSLLSGFGSSVAGTVAANNQLFAQEQAMNNPALNKPGKKDAVESKAALYEKYGKPGEQKLEQEAPAATVVENATADKTEAAAGKMSPTEDQTEETVQPTQPKTAAETAQQEVAPGAAEAAKTETVTEGEPVETQAEEQTVTSAPAQSEQTENKAINKQTENDEQVELQRKRPNGVREQAVPVTDPQGGNVSEFAGNAYQSALTPDSFTDSITRLVEEGQVSHDVQTNEESLRKGAEMIAKAGTERKAVNELRDFANTGKFTPEYIAMGTLLYQDLTSQIDEQTKNGNADPNLQQDAEDVFVSLQQMATNSGRALQLYNLFRKMTPESQVRVMEKEVQRNVEKMQKAGTVKKGYQSSIDPELSDMYRQAAQEYQKAKSDSAKREAEQKMQDIQNVIYVEEAAKLPTTFKAKWDAWRYMSMLGNVKTQVRNFVGNAMMLPYTDAKRAVGTILEKGIAKDQRTKAVFVDRQLMNWAKQDQANVKSVLEGSAKLGDSTTGNPLTEGVKTFGKSWIGERANDLQGIINKTVSGGDMLFKNGEYSRSLAGFLKARGYTGADVQNDTVPVEVMNEARNYAVNEAMKATFNDTNKLSDALSNGLRYKGDNPVMKAINMFGEGIMPFRKTPANVVMRFKDYSPAGLVQGMWNLAKNVRNGKVTAATAIDQIASGLTGTALMQLGYVLAGGIAGVKITGSGADEDEKRQGHQDYALEFSVNGQEYSFTIDWASPANLPLFLGANIRQMKEAPDTESFLTATANAARGAMEPLLQLSCMSSLNDFFESNRYAEEGSALYTAIANVATSYFTQGIPALARQATQSANQYKQTTFTTSDDPIIQDAQQTISGLGVGNAYKTDKVNAWGEKESTGTTGERIINAFINPGTLKKIDNSALEQEISRLNKSQEENVTPPYIPKVVSYTDKDGNKHNNHRMTEEEYQTLAQTQGQTARRILEAMISNKNYAAMTDEQKAKAMQKVYSYARETAMQKAFPNHLGYPESWMLELKQGNEASEILRNITNSELNRTMSNLDTAWDNKYSTGVTDSYSRELETAYDSYSKMTADQKRQVKEFATGNAAKYIEAREKGISHADFITTARNVNNVKGTGKNGTVRDIDRRQAIAKTTGLTPAEVDKLMRVYMPDYDENDESPETTEFKYQYIREELDLSANEYASTYRAYLDGEKKAGKIAAIMALGYDYRTANSLYKVYNGSMKQKLIAMYG